MKKQNKKNTLSTICISNIIFVILMFSITPLSATLQYTHALRDIYQQNQTYHCQEPIINAFPNSIPLAINTNQNQLNALLYTSNIQKNLSNNNVEKVSENLQNLTNIYQKKLLNPAIIIQKLLEALTIPTNQWETILLKQHIAQAIHPFMYILYHTPHHYNKTTLQNQIQKAQNTINETKAPQNALRFHLDFLQAIIDNLPKTPHEQNETKSLIIATHQLLQQTKNNPVSLAQATKKIHLHLKKKTNTTWYQIVLYINHLKQQTQNNPIALTYLQEILENYKKPTLKPQNKITQQINNLLGVKNQHHHNPKGNWHILYAGIDTLTHMAIHTPNLQTYLKTPHNILHYLNIQNQQQLSHPAYNWRIREKILESTLFLIQHKNLQIQQQATHHLFNRAIKEKDTRVTNILQQPSLITAITETLQKNWQNTPETFEKILAKHTQNIEEHFQNLWAKNNSQYTQNLEKQQKIHQNIASYMEKNHPKGCHECIIKYKIQFLAIVENEKYKIQEQLDTLTTQNEKLAKRYNNILAKQQTIANIHNNPAPTTQELKNTLQTIHTCLTNNLQKEIMQILQINQQFKLDINTDFLQKIYQKSNTILTSREKQILTKTIQNTKATKENNDILTLLQKEILENTPHQHYISLKVISTQDKESIDIDKAVHDFLKEKSTKKCSLVIKGNSGAGKTTYMHYLYHQLWKTRKPNDPIPLLLSLKNFVNVTDQLVETALKQEYTIWEEKANHLRKKYRFLLLLDGYDEMNSTKSLYQNYNLNTWADKVIVTIHQEYPITTSCFVPYKNNIPQKQLCQEITLQPFDQEQINNYFKTIAQAPHSIWQDWHLYRNTLDKMPIIAKIASNPLTLQIICYVFANKEKKNILKQHPTSIDIYTALIRHTINHDKKKAHIPVEKYLKFAQKLAIAMLCQKEKKITYQYPKKNNTWIFTNPSFYSYFITQAICDQIFSTIDTTFNTNNLLLNKTLLNNEHEVLQLLTDITLKSTMFKQQLFSYIETSKNNPNIAIAAANSATILAKANIPLNDLDWQGIRISGANLDGAFLARTNFSGSDCRNLSVKESYLENTKWVGTQIKGIDFGAYPYLEHPWEVTEAIWAPHNLLATSSQDNLYIYIWDTESSKLLHTCKKHKDSIRAIKWSPKGNKIATASDDSTICIWHRNGNHIATCQGHLDYVNTIAWSPDGKKLASASDDNTVCIWDATTGNVIKVCKGHTEAVKSVTWSPDNQYIASASDDKTICIWDATTGNPYKKQTYTSTISHVCWSPNSNKIAIVSTDQSIYIYDTIHATTQECKGHLGLINAIQWSSTKKLASASNDHTIRIWNEHGKPLALCNGHTGEVNDVKWSPNATKLASASSDKTVRVWDATNGKLLREYRGHTYYVNSVSWSEDGTKIASASEDKTVRIWNGNIKIPHKYTTSFSCVDWSQDGKMLAVGSKKNTVQLWDSKRGKVMCESPKHCGGISCIRWSPNKQHFASGGIDAIVYIWQGHTGKLLYTCKQHIEDISCLAWSPNGKQLASSSYDSTLCLWDTNTGKMIQHCKGPKQGINAISWSSNGDQIASSSWDNMIYIWHAFTGNILYIYKGHENWIVSLQWSPKESSKLASGSWDKSVHILDIGDQKTHNSSILQYRGHRDFISSIDWSPNGKKIASASWDKTTQVWDINTGKICYTCKNPGNIQIVKWSANGKKLASLSDNNTVTICNGNTGKIICICKNRKGLITTISWCPNNKKIITVNDDKTMYIWDAQKGHIIMLLGNQNLFLWGLYIENAHGLSLNNHKLIIQNKGIVSPYVPTDYDNDEKKDIK